MFELYLEMASSYLEIKKCNCEMRISGQEKINSKFFLFTTEPNQNNRV